MRIPTHHRLLSIPLTLTLAVACTGDDGATATSASSTTEAPTSTAPTSSTSGDSDASSSSSTSVSGTDSASASGTTGDGSSSSTTGDLSSGGSSSTTGDDGTSSTTDDTTTGDTTTGGVIETCDEFAPAFEAEVTAIRGCTEDAECGQVLQGTSCGCTRNWVARLDANTDAFFDLVDLGDELGCELPFVSTCDCPAADGYSCTDNVCEWNYI